MVENVIFSYALVDVKSRNDLIEKNEYWHQLYKRLRKEGYRNLRYIPAKNLTGKDYEGSVDGAHQTDLGFQDGKNISQIFEKITQNPSL